MNKETTMEELFDEKAKTTVSNGGFLADVDDDYEPLDFDTDAIKSFIKEEISIAVQKERERIIDIVIKNKYIPILGNGITLVGKARQVVDADKVINLINKD